MNIALSGETLVGYSVINQSMSANFLTNLGPFTGDAVDPIGVFGFAPYTKTTFWAYTSQITIAGDDFLIASLTGDPLDIPTRANVVINFQDIISTAPPITATMTEFVSSGTFTHTYVQPGRYDTVAKVFDGSTLLHTFPIASTIIEDLPPISNITVFKENGDYLAGISESHQNPSHSPLISPVTLILCASATTEGTYKIEKLVWDPGDGSPLITITRNRVPTDPNITFSSKIRDILMFATEDPRNYVVQHTYYRNNIEDISRFSPSLTVYSQVTNNSSTETLHNIGPFKLQPFLPRKIIRNSIFGTGNDIMLFLEDSKSITYSGIIPNSKELFHD